MRYCNTNEITLHVRQMTSLTPLSVRFLILAGSCLLPLTPAFAAGAADEADAATADAPAPAADQHDRPGNDIVVTGIIERNRVDALSGVAILSGEELAAKAGVSGKRHDPARIRNLTDRGVRLVIWRTCNVISFVLQYLITRYS